MWLEIESRRLLEQSAEYYEILIQASDVSRFSDPTRSNKGAPRDVQEHGRRIQLDGLLVCLEAADCSDGSHTDDDEPIRQTSARDGRGHRLLRVYAK
jgi:hypothetical protein